MNRRILVTGGTTFVSRYVAEYFRDKGDSVTVLNRGNKSQPSGVDSIIGDRHSLGDKLKGLTFDAVLDVTAYTKEDISDLISALPSVKDYVFVSSSAVYPETTHQPFNEDSQVGPNVFWKDYGIHKYEAEECLQELIPHAYILRPPYLYGPGENLYRELYCFDCALEDRPFYVPKDGEMRLQFFHVKDLCRVIENILTLHPQRKVYNVGNPETVTVKEWVEMCYAVAGKKVDLRYVTQEINQRTYFCFNDYEYKLDVTAQKALLSEVVPLEVGLRETFEWYVANLNSAEVARKPYWEFLCNNIIEK